MIERLSSAVRWGGQPRPERDMQRGWAPKAIGASSATVGAPYWKLICQPSAMAIRFRMITAESNTNATEHTRCPIMSPRVIAFILVPPASAGLATGCPRFAAIVKAKNALMRGFEPQAKLSCATVVVDVAAALMALSRRVALTGQNGEQNDAARSGLTT